MSGVLKKYRKIKKLPDWISFFPAMLIRLCKATMRFRMVDPYNAVDLAKLPYITVTWHNRLLFFPAVFAKPFRLRTFALISPSRDGQYVVDLVQRFGVRCVRGSSNKRAASALREAIDVIAGGDNLSMTPDGPRGPRYKMSLGPIVIASKTGRPILPVSVNASRYWEIPSWDRFQIPKPGARLELMIGEPIHVPPDLADAELETWRALVEQKLMAISAVPAVPTVPVVHE